jgi:hypothetical protein
VSIERSVADMHARERRYDKRELHLLCSTFEVYSAKDAKERLANETPGIEANAMERIIELFGQGHTLY